MIPALAPVENKENRSARQPPLKVVVAGHVDHGKSTLIGRLIYECAALPQAKLAEITKASASRNVEFEWAFLLDALQAERDQNITIDSTRLWLRRAARDLILIDVPGHAQFLRNMVTGCSEADLGLLIVDAATGMEEQSRRHALLMRLMGLRHVVVVFNKMDKIGFAQDAFESLKNQALFTLKGLELAMLAAIPVSAKQGDNLSTLSSRMPWFSGPALLGLIDAYVRDVEKPGMPLRFMVQDVLRLGAERVYLGRVLDGTLHAGAEILILPAMRRARVKALYRHDTRTAIAAAHGLESVGVVLDYPLFIERGAVFADAASPPAVSQAPRANLFWLDGAPHTAGQKFTLRMKALSVAVTLQDVKPSALHAELSDAALAAAAPLPLDGPEHPALNSFLLQSGRSVRAIGWFAGAHEPAHIAPKSTNITWSPHGLETAARAHSQGHRGITVWLTGLPSSGKSTIAMEVERRLFARGWHAYVLDGDNLRHGLNSDLSFEDADRKESIRRAGEAAALFADAGVVALVAMVSPFAVDRQALRARSPGSFYEIHIQASVEACQRRDPKKLYEKARRGEIKGFTGVDAPYEAPQAPDLRIDTESLTPEEAADLLEEQVLAWAKN